MSAHRSWFSTYQKLNPPQKVWLGDDRYILAVGEGRIALNMDLGNRTVPAIVQKVLHVPDIQGNLLSVSALIRNGLHVSFEPNGCQILNQNSQLVGMAHMEGDLYILHARASPPEQAYTCTVNQTYQGLPASNIALTAKAEMTSKADTKTWHRCLGHISVSSVLQMVRKGLVKGMALTKDKKSKTDPPCEPCLHGKQTQQPIVAETSDRKTMVLAHVFSDVCGKMQTRSRTGYEYFVTFIDDASRLVNVAFLKEKSEVLHHFKVEWVEVQTGNEWKPSGAMEVANMAPKPSRPTSSLKASVMRKRMPTPRRKMV